MPRTILHLDLDAFFCAVEELLDPSLRGKAFAVGGSPEDRGVVASCSYAARSFGVRSAMPMSRALRLCPGLIVISHHRGEYGAMSERVMQCLHEVSPTVEQVSIDEAFADLTGLADARGVTLCLQTRIRQEIGLPCSAGIASSKLVAKIATEVGKRSGRKGEPPNALLVVPPGSEQEFLAPLPVEMLWGVGPKTAERLNLAGIKTIGELARRPEADLVRWFGMNGREMWQHAHGHDDRPLVTESEAKSISQEVTFSRDLRDDRELDSTLRRLCEEVGRRLRRCGQSGTTVRIKVRYPDFTTFTRQVSLSQPSDNDEDIIRAALALFHKARPRGKAVRLIGVGISGFKPPLRQLGLWDADHEKQRRLQEAVDTLCEKYGRRIISRGRRG